MNLGTLLQGILQTLPVSVVLTLIWNYWASRSVKSQEKLELRLESMEKAILQVQLTLASQNIQEMREKMDQLEEAEISIRADIRELFRTRPMRPI